MTTRPDLDKLQRRLGYVFDDPARLRLALTHRSKSRSNYERMEFLGDSLLGFVISNCLFQQFPDQPEGVLTRLRAKLVRQRSLASVARTFELGEYLVLGSGEGKSGGHLRDSTLSDVFEAIIAAIYLDGGIDAARPFITRTFMDILASLDPGEELKDPKSALQEWLQQSQFELPEYEITEISGKDHKQMFQVECRIGVTDNVFTGRADSRRKAEQKAAARALEFLKKGWP